MEFTSFSGFLYSVVSALHLSSAPYSSLYLWMFLLLDIGILISQHRKVSFFIQNDLAEPLWMLSLFLSFLSLMVKV